MALLPPFPCPHESLLALVITPFRLPIYWAPQVSTGNCYSKSLLLVSLSLTTKAEPTNRFILLKTSRRKILPTRTLVFTRLQPVDRKFP